MCTAQPSTPENMTSAFAAAGKTSDQAAPLPWLWEGTLSRGAISRTREGASPRASYGKTLLLGYEAGASLEASPRLFPGDAVDGRVLVGEAGAASHVAHLPGPGLGAAWLPGPYRMHRAAAGCLTNPGKAGRPCSLQLCRPSCPGALGRVTDCLSPAARRGPGLQARRGSGPTAGRGLGLSPESAMLRVT